MNDAGALRARLRPCVFLDRDGVLNVAPIRDGKPVTPTTPGDVEMLPGIVEACERLRAAGLVFVVVTNQPEIARGTTTAGAVDAINEVAVAGLGVERVVVCPHDDADGCPCRKPKPGMIVDSAASLGLDLARSTMVGDRWRDVEAGQAAHVATVFVDRGYTERKPQAPDLVVGGLPEAVPFIIEQARDKEHAA